MHLCVRSVHTRERTNSLSVFAPDVFCARSSNQLGFGKKGGYVGELQRIRNQDVVVRQTTIERKNRDLRRKMQGLGALGWKEG
ncbi:hypothetical protein IE53DRAFT_126061 [Violaceomyces palustris]|uniref:Uncharacterized protein n=1 Tax=Violaceomyces palustris TaxID=1673888 RepID=A0ACD0NVD5_9BASI|nr:hypothetical protein IE53DRAFT_126061 [Violaceomyces palustris]